MAGNDVNQYPGGLDKVNVGLLSGAGACRESGREVHLSLIAEGDVNNMVLPKQLQSPHLHQPPFSRLDPFVNSN